MNVVAETTNDFYLGFDIINKSKNENNNKNKFEDNNEEDDSDMTPEELSKKCCLSFLEEIFYVKF